MHKITVWFDVKNKVTKSRFEEASRNYNVICVICGNGALTLEGFRSDISKVFISVGDYN